MKMKKIILITSVGACVASWIMVGIGFALEVDKNTFIAIVTTTAIATEVMFWGIAFVFGVSVFESRKKIGNWIGFKLGFKKKPTV